MMSLTNALFKRLLFTANLLVVGIITHTRITCLNVRYSGTVACGDSYEAKIINVMLEVAFKRCPKLCFLETLILKSKWRDQKKKEKRKSNKGLALTCWAMKNWASTYGDMFYYCYLVVTKRPLLQTTTTEVQISYRFHQNIWFWS